MNLWRRASGSGWSAGEMGGDEPTASPPGTGQGRPTRRAVPPVRVAPRTARAGRGESGPSRLIRFILQRVAIVAALLILFYATSLHGISIRTFILAGIEILCLYWIFRGVL